MGGQETGVGQVEDCAVKSAGQALPGASAGGARETCRACHGIGSIETHLRAPACQACGGVGWVDVERPVLLDLFGCAGGAADGYTQAGWQVVGVDKAPQPNYPYPFAMTDALSLLSGLLSGRREFFDFKRLGLDDIGAIHASPPCQSECAYRRRGAGVGDGYEQMIPETRALLEASGLPFVIENVPGAREWLRDPVTLCGSSFGLDVRRHRLFETNWPLAGAACNHAAQKPGRFPGATNRAPMSRATVEVGVYRIPLATQMAAMGHPPERRMTLRELSESLPPAFTRHIGEQMLAHVRSGVTA